MGTLAGKVAIVTGASRGIGRAIAEKLSRDGASIVINYSRSVDEAKTVLTGIESRGGAASLCQADIGKMADVRRLVRETTSRFGRVDIVVNNFCLPPNRQVYPRGFVVAPAGNDAD